MERLEQELRVVRQRFGDDVQNFWKSIHMVCIQKICPKILRDHLAVQASSIDSFEKQRLTIEKFLQANVQRSGATLMDVDALVKTRGGMKGGTGKDKEGKSKKFEGNCVWCGAYGHMIEDCQKKAAGKPQVPQKHPERQLVFFWGVGFLVGKPPDGIFRISGWTNVYVCFFCEEERRGANRFWKFYPPFFATGSAPHPSATCIPVIYQRVSIWS